jgi:preprotein translocase subunit SecF
MEFFKTNTRINFMKQRKWAALFSLVLFAFSIFSLVYHGLNLGLDFTGGLQVEVHFKDAIDPQLIRNTLDAHGFEHAVVTTYTSKDLSIRLSVPKPKSGDNSLEQAKVQQNMTDTLRMQLDQFLPAGHELGQVSFIGSQVGKSLMTNGILAIVVALIATMIYIAMRFDFRFAISAAIALIHDPILILGIFSWFHLDFDLIVLAGLLTVIGYSLNDTVVVYDRVRENFAKYKKKAAVDIMNLSINQTLSRTIMTSGLMLLMVIVLYIFGGEFIHYFALALIIGVVIGTYSSIYVAGALALELGLDRSSLVASALTAAENPQ